MTIYRVRSIGVLSCGMIGCVTGAGMGLVISLFYGLFFLIGSAAGVLSEMGSMGGPEMLLSGGLILVLILIFPIIYGVMGFIGALIYALIYNLAAKLTGGLRMELEDVTHGQTSPY